MASSKWRPHETFAAAMHLADKHIEVPVSGVVDSETVLAKDAQM